MELNKGVCFLGGLLLVSHITLCQTFEIKSQTFKADLNKENSLFPKKNPKTELPSYLKKEFLEGVSNSNKKNEYFDQPKINMESQESFIDPGDYYLNKLSTPEESKNPNGFKVEQYLGDFKSNANHIKIIFRDHEAPDGDRVRIVLNEQVIITNVLLEEQFKQLTIDLVLGFNTLNFIALNQGDSGPNTAEIRVYDDEGSLIMGNQWNLATGAKATLIVVKE